MVKAIYVALIATFLAGLSANDLTCQLCIDVVSAVEDFLTDGATQDDIIAWLEQFCDQLSSKILQNACSSLVHEKLPDIIDLLIDGLPPQGVCEKIGMCNDTIGTTPGPEPDDKWYHLMTELEGGRALKLMPDHHSVEMYGKGEYGDSGQHWRIESNGCLRNQDVSGQCLALEGSKQGAQLRMRGETGTDEQNWTLKDDKYVQSKVYNDEIFEKGPLVLDVVWADVSLITDGAALRGWHKDNTVSQKWNLVPVDP